MKLTKLQMWVLLLAAAVQTTAANAWDFSYGYQYVNAPNAGAYIVGQQNVSRWTEWQSPPYNYWGPTASGTPGLLTMKFDFSAPTSELFLNAHLSSFNWSSTQGHYGASSLWASTDGSSWQLLLDCPTPPESNNHTLEVTYQQDVPALLLGTTTFWLQARLEDWGYTGAVADAQFSRSTSAHSGNIFELDAALVPEPSTLSLGLGIGLALLLARVRRHS